MSERMSTVFSVSRSFTLVPHRPLQCCCRVVSPMRRPHLCAGTRAVVHLSVAVVNEAIVKEKSSCGGRTSFGGRGRRQRCYVRAWPLVVYSPLESRGNLCGGKRTSDSLTADRRSATLSLSRRGPNDSLWTENREASTIRIRLNTDEPKRLNSKNTQQG